MEEVAEPSTKEETILCHLDLVKFLALRMAPRLPGDISVEDLFSAGIIGLMDAIDKFDPSQQIQFKTYAKIRIKGAMLDEIRSLDWIPRSVASKKQHGWSIPARHSRRSWAGGRKRKRSLRS